MNKIVLRLVGLSLTLLLLMACTPGATPLPTPTIGQTLVSQSLATEPPTPLTTPLPTPAPLPPMVLRASPEPGEEAALNAAIEIAFDQPMARASVEKAFAIEPGASVDGQFEWPDDQTLRFKLKNGFERGQPYKARVVETAQSAAGLAMLRPFELRFSAVGTLEVATVAPADGADEILPDTVVTISFNRPVAPLNAIEDAASLPDPLTFTPPVTGKGQWLNTSIYQFTPDKGFAPSTAYQARVAKGLADALGQTSLEQDYEWAFTTVSPAALLSYPANKSVYVSPTSVISVTFNQPMNRQSVEKAFVLRDFATGDPVPGQFTWVAAPLPQPKDQGDGSYYDYEYAEGEGPAAIGVETVSFKPDKPLEFGVAYTIELPKGLKNQTGQSQTRANFKSGFTVIPYPEIISTSPKNGEQMVSAGSSLQITFSGPMNPASVVVGQNIVINPTIAVTQVYTYWDNRHTELTVNFPSQASSNYKVTLGADIEGRYGQKLGQATNVAWSTRAAQPFAYLHSPGRLATYNAYTDTLVYVTVRNLSQVNFSLYRLPKDDFIRLNGGNWWEDWDAYKPNSDNLLKEWAIETKPELNTSAIYRVNLGQKSGLGDRLPPGLYYLTASFDAAAIYPEARATHYNQSVRRQMLVVSKNNITFKTSGGESLAWITDLQSGQPVPAAPITFMASDDQNKTEKLGQPEKTKADGVAQTDYERRQNAYEARFAFSGDLDNPGDDFAVTMNQWSEGIDRYQFDNISTEDYQQPYNGHFYTDRPIYRPGQTVYFKGIIRADDDARYSLPTAQKTAYVVVNDSQGKEILSDDLPISEFGTINGEIELDENAALGFYSLQATFDGENYFYDDFQVAAYRKPEYRVETTTDKPEYVQGDKIKVTTTAEFYFGGPVSNAAVRWTVLSDDYYFRYMGDSFYDFTDYDYSRYNYNTYQGAFGEQIAEGKGVTDKDGRFTFEIDADIAKRIASQRFTLDVTITDLNNQEVASQATAVVHKGLFYIGLHPERYVGLVGQESQINVLTVDWQSQSAGGQEVQVVFAEHNWYSVQKQYEDGSFYWDSTVEDVPVYTTTVTTDQSGKATAAFTPQTGGVYKISASGVDSRRNKVYSSAFMWVSGRKYVNWRQENNDRLSLVADKREYKVGDTATILVPHPYSGTVQALFTLERGHVYKYWVQELTTNSEQIKVPITADMLPNMYLSVVVVRGADGGENGLPSFKVGYASLPINTKEKELKITLTPDKPAGEKYQPGETAAYKVKVTDLKGQPVKAELSLALVDKAVLALSPETPGQLQSTFWRQRGLGVQTAGGLTLAIDRVNLAVAPEAKGGGGGFDEGFGVIRGDFQDTALWLADFKTNANGEGMVQAKLPDNLTTWTLTGKGVTGADTLVGESIVDIVSAKPLLVRPVAPRFFVVGDEAQVGLIAQNNTTKDLEVETRFEAKGMTITPLSEPKLTIKAGERVKVEYKVTVDDVKTVELTMGAKSPDYGDALAFELPVYRFSAEETVATVGVLEQDGARVEGISLPSKFDPSQGDLRISVDASLAAGMRDGLDYLEHFPYECTEQTVSRFLPNVVTYRALKELKMEDKQLEEKLPALVSLGLQRLYSKQHMDGGWGWWLNDHSQPFLTAYVLLGLIEAQRAGFEVNEEVMMNGANYLQASMVAPKDVTEAWEANRQAFMLYVLAEAGQGDLGRSVALFKQREKLDMFGRAYLALAIYQEDNKASQVKTLLSDITTKAIVSGTGAHWEESQVDYYAMNTDTRSTAVIIAALSRLDPQNPILPNAVRWLMSIREHAGHWETTQETAWAVIGLTDWMVATGELEGNYAWRVSLNGQELGSGAVNIDNIGDTHKLRSEVGALLKDTVNRLSIERNPAGEAVSGSKGRLYYAAYLNYYKPAETVKALNRGIIVSRQYSLADDETGKPISAAKVGDVIQVKLTLVAPNDLHYVVVEDPLPAGAEGVDTSLATTSVVGEAPELTRTDRRNPWGRGYGWWWFSHAELRDEKAVLFATYLPKGTYEYTYSIRASLPGQFRVIPTHAEEMYFPEVFGRGDGGLFKISP